MGLKVVHDGITKKQSSFAVKWRDSCKNSFVRVCILSRCSKLFYTISRCYFYIESTFSGASISFVLSHIARYDPLRFPHYRGTEIFARRK